MQSCGNVPGSRCGTTVLWLLEHWCQTMMAIVCWLSSLCLTLALSDNRSAFPAGTRRNNNVFTTSTRRRRRRVDVVKTLSLRHHCVLCPLGCFSLPGTTPVPEPIMTHFAVAYTEPNGQSHGEIPVYLCIYRVLGHWAKMCVSEAVVNAK